jgi:hypothetical protein
VSAVARDRRAYLQRLPSFLARRWLTAVKPVRATGVRDGDSVFTSANGSVSPAATATAAAEAHCNHQQQVLATLHVVQRSHHPIDLLADQCTKVCCGHQLGT